MSAVAAFSGPAAAYLMSDRGYYDDDGRLIYVCRKCVGLPKLGIAVVMTGRAVGEWQDALQDWARQFGKQADALAAFPSFVRQMADCLIEGLGLDHPDRAQYYLIGAWLTEQSRPQLYLCADSADKATPGYQPMTMQPIGDMMSPAVGFDLSIAGHFDGFDPVKFGRRFAEAQRHQAFERGGYMVAAGADMAIIDANGVRIRQVAHWPDPIGQKVDPNRRTWRISDLFRRAV